MRVVAAVFLTFLLCTCTNAGEFIGLLDGLQENPPNASPGTGVGTVSYLRQGPNQFLTIDLSYSGMVAPTTDAHIHCCATALDQNAIVAISFTGAGGFVTGSTSGTYTHTFDLEQASTYTASYIAASGGTLALARDRLINAMRFGVERDPEPGDTGIAYFNLHSSFRPGGELRGNIVPGVPEPASMMLVACGVAALALRRHVR